MPFKGISNTIASFINKILYITCSFDLITQESLPCLTLSSRLENSESSKSITSPRDCSLELRVESLDEAFPTTSADALVIIFDDDGDSAVQGAL